VAPPSIALLCPPKPPPALGAIRADTAALGFTMASTDATGQMLASLAASKPGGRLLELGTGTGVSTAWLQAGMDRGATLDTMDNNPASVEIARRHLGSDPRLRFHVEDGSLFLQQQVGRGFDLIFADTWPGKFTDLETCLALLAPGGLYVVDDLLPQPSWPPEHAPKIPPLIRAISERDDLTIWPIDWDTGILIAVKRGKAGA
jgi:predicted O-methyltransferase YrrM